MLRVDFRPVQMRLPATEALEQLIRRNALCTDADDLVQKGLANCSITTRSNKPTLETTGSKSSCPLSFVTPQKKNEAQQSDICNFPVISWALEEDEVISKDEAITEKTSRSQGPPDRLPFSSWKKGGRGFSHSNIYNVNTSRLVRSRGMVSALHMLRADYHQPAVQMRRSTMN